VGRGRVRYDWFLVGFAGDWTKVYALPCGADEY